MIGSARGHLGLDLEGHRHLGPDQTDKVGDDLVGDAAGVSTTRAASSVTVPWNRLG